MNEASKTLLTGFGERMGITEPGAKPPEGDPKPPAARKMFDDSPPPAPPPQPDPKPSDNPPPTPPSDEPPPAPQPKPSDGGFKIPDVLLKKPADVEPPAAPTPTEPGDKDAKAFAQMRIRNAELESQLKERAGLSQERFTELQKSLEDAQNTIAMLDLSRDPRFKSQFEQPMNVLSQRGKQMLTELELQPEIFDRATALSLKDRIAYLNQAAPDIAQELRTVLSEMDTIKARRDDALNRHGEIAQQLTQQKQSQIKELQQQVLGESLRSVQADGHFIFSHVEGDEDWNGTVDALLNNAGQMISSGDPRSQAKHILLGVAAPLYMKMYMQEREKREALSKELQKVQSSMPDIGSGGPENTGGSAGSTGKKKSMSVHEMSDSVTRRMARRAAI